MPRVLPCKPGWLEINHDVGTASELGKMIEATVLAKLKDDPSREDDTLGFRETLTDDEAAAVRRALNADNVLGAAGSGATTDPGVNPLDVQNAVRRPN